MTDQAANEIRIQAIYLKDASFEAPNSPTIFNQINNPNMNLNINVGTSVLADDTYEVVLTTTVTAKMDDKTIFLVELHQAGVFLLRGFDENAMGPMLNIYCPNVLFPYAREAVANLVSKGGFPPFQIDPINFEAIYAQNMQQQAAQQQES